MNLLKKLEDASRRTNSTISAELIDEAFHSNIPEHKGIAYSLIADHFFSSKINPPLTFEHYYNYIYDYFVYCLLNNPDSEWCHSRYAMCWDYANWFISWFEDSNLREYLEKIKCNIAWIYKNGDNDIRVCLETAFLEHILINEETIQFFSNWRDNEELSRVLERCTLRKGNDWGQLAT